MGETQPVVGFETVAIIEDDMIKITSVKRGLDADGKMIETGRDYSTYPATMAVWECVRDAVIDAVCSFF